MKTLANYIGAGLTAVAMCLPIGESNKYLPVDSANQAKADTIQFWNVTEPGTVGFTGELIGGTSNVLDNKYSSGLGITPGYDEGIDSLLDTSINPNSQFFVTYFPLVDGEGGDVAVDFNKSTFPTRIIHEASGQ